MCVLQKIIKDRDEERERLRRELQRSREQLHAMHESQRRSQVSRPSSLVSSEDDTGWCLETHVCHVFMLVYLFVYIIYLYLNLYTFFISTCSSRSLHPLCLCVCMFLEHVFVVWQLNAFHCFKCDAAELTPYGTYVDKMDLIISNKIFCYFCFH